MIYRLDGNNDPLEVKLDNMCYEIVIYTKGQWRSVGFLWMILAYLREHSELCEQPDYKKLYDECLYYIALDWELGGRESKQTVEKAEIPKWIEFIADVQNKNESFVFTKGSRAEVDAFLAYRKYRWGMKNH